MEYQNLQSSQKPKNNLGIWLLVILLFIAGMTLMYFLIDLQYKLDYSNGRFDASLDAISKKNDEIRTFKVNLENANSQITTLTSENQSLSSEIESQNSQIASLSEIRISRVDIVNESCTNQYIFLDGVLAGGTRGDGRTHFYIPPGSHEFQICAEPYRSRCSDKKVYDVDTEVFTFTIWKHPSCP